MALGEAASSRRITATERERLIALVARLRGAEGATNIDDALEAIDALAAGQQTRVRARLCWRSSGGRGACGARVARAIFFGARVVTAQPGPSARAATARAAARAVWPVPPARAHGLVSRALPRRAAAQTVAARSFSRVLRAHARSRTPRALLTRRAAAAWC
jgi:hypothetical protein